MKRVRTRFAPSPTGLCHIGGIRTALFSYLYAKQNKGEFILRIEDTDRERIEENSIDNISESLDWLDIEVDEAPWTNSAYAPYTQSEREYLSYANTLIESGHAYYCFDTREELSKASLDWGKLENIPGYGIHTRMDMKNSLTMSTKEVATLLCDGTDYVIRFKMVTDQTITFNDEIRGEITFNVNDLNDTILFKSNGLPSYHLANVVDDHLMKISHVFRGEEWIPSTPLHCLLYDAFGWDRPVFAHLPLLLSPDGKKISKRTAHKYGLSVAVKDFTSNDGLFVEGYESMGYEADAILNFLFLCGFTPKDNVEFMNIEEMIESFDITRVSKAGAKMDKDKLNHINSHYVRNKSNILTWALLSQDHGLLLPPHLYNGKPYNSEKLDSILEVAKERSVFRKDLIKVVDIFCSEISKYEEGSEKKIDEGAIKVLKKFLKQKVDYSDKDVIKQSLYDLSLANDVKFGKVMPTLRVAITGGKSGADLVTSMYILGEEESKKRINKMIEIFG